MNQKDAEAIVKTTSFGIMVVIPAFIYAAGIHATRKRNKIQKEKLILIAQAYARLEQKMMDPTTTMSDIQKLWDEDHAFLEMIINRPSY